MRGNQYASTLAWIKKLLQDQSMRYRVQFGDYSAYIGNSLEIAEKTYARMRGGSFRCTMIDGGTVIREWIPHDIELLIGGEF